MQRAHTRGSKAGTGLDDSAVPIQLEVDDPDSVAQRCWDAGLTVRLRHDEMGRASMSVIDPFGRQVDLVPRTTRTTTPLDTSQAGP
jgi:hypothetical protein